MSSKGQCFRLVVLSPSLITRIHPPQPSANTTQSSCSPTGWRVLPRSRAPVPYRLISCIPPQRWLRSPGTPLPTPSPPIRSFHPGFLQQSSSQNPINSSNAAERPVSSLSTKHGTRLASGLPIGQGNPKRYALVPPGLFFLSFSFFCCVCVSHLRSTIGPLDAEQKKRQSRVLLQRP